MLALLVAFVALLALQRVLELRLSRRHESALKGKGAYERGAGHYPIIVGLHAAWLVSILVEGWLRGAELSPWRPFWGALFLGGQTLRYWAIPSLGERWTTRVIVLPGAPLVLRGDRSGTSGTPTTWPSPWRSSRPRWYLGPGLRPFWSPS